jgi:hypothetical protein
MGYKISLKVETEQTCYLYQSYFDCVKFSQSDINFLCMRVTSIGKVDRAR